MNQTAQRLRERREAAGLSQGQVAQYEKISQSYLSDLERGRNEPAVWSLLVRLATRYRTSTDYLLGLTDDPSPAETRNLTSVVQKILIVALQLSENRQQESLRIIQALLDMEREEQASSSPGSKNP